jgi:hypothetical protein
MKRDTKQRPDGGRPPQNANADVTARHRRDDLPPGDADAATHARPTRTGENDSRRADPDQPDQP